MLRFALPLIVPPGGRVRTPREHGVPDAELLRRIADNRDEAAFAALFDRHGARVWGVCRRIAGDAHLAEDVLQATFLLMIRNSRTIRNPASLAAWLHGTAYRLAVQARRQARRRGGFERRAAINATSSPLDELSSRELFAILDEELARLPERLREPLILCYLDGLSQDEAARRLGLSAGSIKGRLERGRAKLAMQLRQRGLGPSTLLLASLATVAVPAGIRASVLKLIQPGAAVSAAVAALLRKSAMSMTMRVGTACSILVAVLAAGLGITLTRAEKPDNPPQETKRETPPETATEMLPQGAIARLGTARLRPGGSIEFLAFSPDSKRLASFTQIDWGPYETSIWDVATGRELKRMPQPGNVGRSMIWLGDGRGAAVMNLNWLNDGGFFTWDFASEDAVRPPVGNLGVGVRMVPANPRDNETDSCFAISPDGKFLAVGRSGNEKHERAIELREFVPGKRTEKLKVVRKLGMHPGNCDYLYFSPDGKTLLSINQIKLDRKPAKELFVVAWDVANGNKKWEHNVPTPIIQGTRPTIAVSNEFLALGIEDDIGTLRLYDLATGKGHSFATGHKSTFKGSGYGVSAVAFSADGRTLVTGGRDNLVRVWDTATHALRRTLNDHASWVESLAISPDGKMLASGGQGGVIRIWDLATGADACPQPGHVGGLNGVSISPDGKTAITSGRDGTMRVWDVAAARELRVIDAGGGITRAELSPDRRLIVAGGFGQSLRGWDAATGKPAQLPGKLAGAKVRSSRFVDAQTLLTIQDGEVILWDWPAGTVRREFVLPAPAKKPGTAYCENASLSPDGKFLVTVGNRYWYRENRGMRFGYAADGVIDLWDAASGKRIRRLLQSTGCPRTATFTADGDLIIQGGGGELLNADGSVGQVLKSDLNLIDPLTSRLRRSFAAIPSRPGAGFRYIVALELSPDGRSLYVADSSGVAAVYEIATGQIRRTISGHRALLTGLALPRDGKRLVTASLDSTALVWDLSPAAAFPPPAKPPTIDLATAWEGLSNSASADAYRAMANLDAAPKEAVAFLASKLSPAKPGPKAELLDKLVANLAGEKFAVREKASVQLAKLGESAVPGLRERLAKVSSAEARQRLIRVLEQLDPPELSPRRLQTKRAIELLEMIGTPEARALLQKLAGGDPNAGLTRDARQSLNRVESRN